MTDAPLADTLTLAWSCLEAGAAPGKSRFSMVQLASIGADGRDPVDRRGGAPTGVSQ